MRMRSHAVIRELPFFIETFVLVFVIVTCARAAL